MIALAALRWRHGQFDWGLMASALLDVRITWLVAAVTIAIATYYGRALRWALLIRHLRPKPSMWGLFSATAIGFTAIVVLGRPGELVRPYLIASKEKLPFSSQLAAWFLERICDLLSTLLIFGFTLVYVTRTGLKVGPRLEWALEMGGYVAGALGIISLLVVGALRQHAAAMRSRAVQGLALLPERWRARAVEMFDAFLLGIQATRSRSGLAGIVGYTALEWGLIVLCFLALARSFPALDALDPADIMILLGFVAFGSLIQIPGIGGGMQVMAVVVLTEVFRMPLETAAGVAMMIWLVTFVVIVPVGLLLLIRQGMNWRMIRDISEAAKP